MGGRQATVRALRWEAFGHLVDALPMDFLLLGESGEAHRLVKELIEVKIVPD